MTAGPTTSQDVKSSESDSLDCAYLVDAVGIEPTICRLRVERLRVSALYPALLQRPIISGLSDYLRGTRSSRLPLIPF
jgi:hypothetical protein